MPMQKPIVFRIVSNSTQDIYNLFPGEFLLFCLYLLYLIDYMVK